MDIWETTSIYQSVFPSSLDAEVKGLCGMYQRIILVPRPDYASRVVIWRALIQNYGGQITESLDISSLAKVTDGYTPGHIHTAVSTVLTDRRVQQVLIGSFLVHTQCMISMLSWVSWINLPVN